MGACGFCPNAKTHLLEYYRIRGGGESIQRMLSYMLGGLYQDPDMGVAGDSVTPGFQIVGDLKPTHLTYLITLYTLCIGTTVSSQ